MNGTRDRMPWRTGGATRFLTTCLAGGLAGAILWSAADGPARAADAASSQAGVGGTVKLPGAPADLDAAIRDAQALRRAGDLAGASKTLGQLVIFAPDDPRVLGEYGKTLAAEGHSDDALAFLERAIQLQPGDWTLYSARGVAFDQKADFPAAQTAYAQALALKPGEPTVLNNDALSHMQSGDLDGAESLLHQAAPGSVEFPRIAQNLTLVQSLKAARAAAPPSAPPPPAMAPTSSPATAPRPASVVRASLAAPAPGPGPAVIMQRMPPEPAKTTAAAEHASPPPRKHAPAQAAPAKKTEPPLLASAYYVQAGSFDTEWQAVQRAATLDRLGARVSPATQDGHAVYRVRIGPFQDVSQANIAIGQAEALGHKDVAIVSE